MQVSIYRLHSSKLKGSIYAAYRDGYLVSLEFSLTVPLTDAQANFFFQQFPYALKDLEALTTSSGMKVTEIKNKSVQDKLMSFGIYYKQYRQVPYRATTLEKANIATVPVDEALLTYFFTSKAWFIVNNYTLSNYIKRINLIRDAAANGLEQAETFPNTYNQKYADSLDKDTLQRYYQHLRSQGYKYVQTGNGWAWIKESKKQA